jgi:hypothetical protein
LFQGEIFSQSLYTALDFAKRKPDFFSISDTLFCDFTISQVFTKRIAKQLSLAVANYAANSFAFHFFASANSSSFTISKCVSEYGTCISAK